MTGAPGWSGSERRSEMTRCWATAGSSLRERPTASVVMSARPPGLRSSLAMRSRNSWVAALPMSSERLEKPNVGTPARVYPEAWAYTSWRSRVQPS